MDGMGWGEVRWGGVGWYGTKWEWDGIRWGGLWGREVRARLGSLKHVCSPLECR